MGRFARSLFFLAAVEVLFPNIARAGYIGPGTYYGYVAVDRWKQDVFHTGPYHLFMSDEVARDLAQYRGKPLELNVTQVDQPMNPGGAMIRQIGKVAVKPGEPGLVLSLKPVSQKVEKGKGISVKASLRNESDRDIEIRTQSLALVLVTNKPFPNSAIGYKDPGGRAYWYYGSSYQSYEKRPPHERLVLRPFSRKIAPPDTWEYRFVSHRVACREIAPWSGRQLIEQGEKIKPSKRGLMVNGSVVIEPKGQFETTVTVGKELLAGEYEIFFHVNKGNLSYGPGPMSKRIPFDVVGSPASKTTP